MLIAAILVLSGADALRCPDGCTDGTQAAATAHSQADGACLLCSGGIDRAVDQTVPTSDSCSRNDTVFASTAPPSIALPAVEHPPRT